MHTFTNALTKRLLVSANRLEAHMMHYVASCTRNPLNIVSYTSDFRCMIGENIHRRQLQTYCILYSSHGQIQDEAWNQLVVILQNKWLQYLMNLKGNDYNQSVLL